MSEVPHFGVHEDPETGVRWLLQGRDAFNGVGLPEKYCPLKVSGNKNDCPHKFNFEDEGPSKKLLKLVHTAQYEPLFQAMMPFPVSPPKTHYIVAESLTEVSAISTMQAMCNPSLVCHTSADVVRMNHRAPARVLSRSNIIRYSAFGFTLDHISAINSLAALADQLPGRLILMGERIPKFGYDNMVEFHTIPKSMVDLISSHRDIEDWKKLGIKYMRDYLKCQSR